jgi:hypothetical protein
VNVAPAPQFPERSPNVFERSMAPSIPMNKGPLRFEEGVATDTDVPRDFGRGAYADTAPAPGRMNHNNPEMFYKYPEETMRERAHVGSASWIEAPSVLREFVQGSMSGDGMPQFEYEQNSGMHMNRQNATVVND